MVATPSRVRWCRRVPFLRLGGPSTDVITDFMGEDSIEFIDDTTGAVAQAKITTDADSSTVTWDDLTIMLDRQCQLRRQ